MFRKFTVQYGVLRRFPYMYSTNISREIPSAKGLPLIGTTLSLLVAGSAPKLHFYIDARHKELGPIFQEKLGSVNGVFISDPDAMRSIFSNEGKYPRHILPEPWIVYNKIHGCNRGLFFMDGEEWLENRRKMNKLLLKGDVKWIQSSCQVATHNLIDHITANEGYISNLEALLYRWSLDVIVAILIGDNTFINSQHIFRKDLDKLAEITHLIFQTTSKLSLLPVNFAQRLKLPRWKYFEKSVDDVLETATIFVDKIFEQHLEGNGLLSKMLEESIDKKMIIRIITDLILAAGDTTAFSFEWILYLVSKHAEVQEKLHHESSDNSPLLRNVIKESLRLYPVAPFLTRFLPQDTNMDGYIIPKNIPVILSIYTSGRDSQYFKSPTEFIPDRWLRDETGNLKQMLQATMPFAIGARSCIGRKIAEIQLQVALNEIVKKFSITLANKKEIAMKLQMVAVPSEPIQLRFTKR